MTAKLRVVLIYRKRREGGHSIEGLFTAIAGELNKEAEVIEFVAASRSKIFHDLWRLKSLAADIYHITGDVNYFSLLLPRNKTVLTVHDTGHYTNTLKGMKRWLYKWLWLVLPIRGAGRVTAISESTRNSIRNDLGVKREVTVIENCYGMVFRHVPKQFNESHPLVLQIGTQPHKNLQRLIQALQGLSCRLAIIGKLNSELEAQLSEADIAFENYVNLSNQEVFEHYAAADLVCFASLFEGFGVPIIEANAVGRPLITSNIEPMRSIAGNAACLVDPKDTNSIREAVVRIIHDRVYRECLVLNGLSNAKRYSPATVAAGYLEVYRRLSPEK